MPERWERELRRLDDVDAPVSEIRSRADQPPRSDDGSGPPPTRQRVVAGVVAFGVFIAAASFGWLAFRSTERGQPADAVPSDPGALVIEVHGPLGSDSPPGDFFHIGADRPTLILSDGEIALEATMVGYDWCDSSGRCAGAAADYDVTEFLPVSPGQTIEVTGSAAQVVGRFNPWRQEGSSSPMFAGTPADPGRYELLVDATFAEGTVQFSVGVEVARSSGRDPSGEATDVLRIRCDGDTTVVKTPVVIAQADGVHVEVLPIGGDRMLTFREAGAGRATFGGRVAVGGRSQPLPIAPGPVRVACGPTMGPVAEAAAFEVVDPNGNWTTGELSCDMTARAEVVAYDGGAAAWVDEEAMIRGILRGVRESDRIVPALYGRDRLLRWVIVRDGAEVGVVRVIAVTDATDPGGGGLGRVDGEVCAAADIDGTVRPRDPDGDGVDLDCMAAKQIVFETPGNPVLFGEAEPFMRGVVAGIRYSDDLLPPDESGGSDPYEGVWTVVREGKVVASIAYPSLGGISCRWSAIGIDPAER